MEKKVELELERIVTKLESLNKRVSKHNISLYRNRDIITDDCITKLKISEFMAKRELQLANEMTGVAEAKPCKNVSNSKATKLRVHNECFDKFKKVIESMIENNENLSSKNIMANADGFNKYYLYNNAEAKEYLNQKRREIGFKTEVRGAKKKQATVVFQKKEVPTEIHSAKIEMVALTDFDIAFFKDEIDTFAEEHRENAITVKELLEGILDLVQIPFDAKTIKSCEAIMSHLDEKNTYIKDNVVLGKVKAVINKMKTENICLNRYTIINRCSSFMNYQYLTSHPAIVKLIESSVK